MNEKQVASEIYKSAFFRLISWTNKWQRVLALLAVGSEGQEEKGRKSPSVSR